MTNYTPLMAGKKGVIMGLANDKSIAWGIAQALHAQGAEFAITYQGEKLEKRVRPLAEQVGCNTLVECDVTNSASFEAAIKEVGEKFGKIDFLIHAIAFSDKEELKGRFIDSTLPNFLNSMHISCFSFIEACKYAAPYMTDGGCCLTLTYYGAEQVVPNYNVMGVCKSALECSVRYLANDLGPQKIRVNAISAGPIRTLAAAGIGDFRKILKWNEANSPLRRNNTIEEVGGMAMSLVSDLGQGVTGEVLHVDSGYHTVGMMAIDNVEGNLDFFEAFKGE